MSQSGKNYEKRRAKEKNNPWNEFHSEKINHISINHDRDGCSSFFRYLSGIRCPSRKKKRGKTTTQESSNVTNDPPKSGTISKVTDVHSPSERPKNPHKISSVLELATQSQTPVDRSMNASSTFTFESANIPSAKFTINVEKMPQVDIQSSCLQGIFRQGDQERLKAKKRDGDFAATVNRTSLTSMRDEASELCGLSNLGNTCFMNSALQCLSHTAPLRGYFIGSGSMYQQDINRSNPHGTGGVLAESFAQLLQYMWSQGCTYTRPTDFKRIFGEFAPHFSGYSQEDSQEFLTYLLDGLHEDLNKANGMTEELTEMLSKAESGTEDEKLANEAWVEYLSDDNSKIVDLYQVQLRSCLTCGNEECQDMMTTFDSFRCLSLNIPDNCGTMSKCTYSCCIEDCLKLMTQTSESREKNWPCQKCNNLVKLKNKTDIWRTPEILIVYFKRFRTTKFGRRKLCTSISFPVHDLDLSPFVSNPDCQCHYDLYATINHSGSVHGGHYTAKALYNGKWYLFDDTRVRELKDENEIVDPIQASTAYVLFYQKVSAKTSTEELSSRLPCKRKLPTDLQTSPAGTSNDAVSLQHQPNKILKVSNSEADINIEKVNVYGKNEDDKELLIVQDDNKCTVGACASAGGRDTSTYGENKPIVVPSLETSSLCDHVAITENPSTSDGNYPTPALLHPTPEYPTQQIVPGVCGLYFAGSTTKTTSFANSVIQCLSNTTHLRKNLIQFGSTLACHPDATMMKGCNLAKSFAQLIQDMWTGKYTSVNPTTFMKEVERINSRFSGKTDEDAQEFITFLLDGLNKDLDKLVEQNSKVFHEAKMVEKVQVQNPIKSLFQGTMRSSLKCHNTSCQCVIAPTNDFMNLPLPIPEVNDTSPIDDTHFTIEDGLKIVTQKGDERKWRCAKCETEYCRLNVDIVTQPEILLLYIERFRTLNHSRRQRRKIYTRVKFPIKSLDLSQFSSTPGKQCYYDLYATINHIGSADDGHYTAYVRNEGKWYFFDDNEIRLLQDTNEVTDVNQLSTVHVLFYEKRVQIPGHTLRRKVPDLSKNILPTKGLVNRCKTKVNVDGLSKPVEKTIDTGDKASEVDCSEEQCLKDSEDGRSAEADVPMDTTDTCTQLLESPQVNSETCDTSTQEVNEPIHDPSQHDRLGLCGLAKLNNNGFVNATIQCLYSIASLRNYFIAEDKTTTVNLATKAHGNLPPLYVNDLNKNNLRGTGGRLAECFADLLQSMGNEGDEVQSSLDKFMKTIRSVAPYFSGGIHQHSQKFLTFLFNQLHEDLNRSDRMTELESETFVNDEAYAHWVDYETKNNSKMVELFQVQCRLLSKCGKTECNHEDVTYDFYRHLLLPIPRQPCALEVCFESVMKATTNSQSSFCQKCYTTNFRNERIQISRAPPVLIIYLERFHTDGNNVKHKSPVPVSFPIKSLDVSPYLCDSDKQCHYDLYATVHHTGDVTDGHYIAFARRREKWFMFDDDQVNEVEQPNPTTDLAHASSVCVLFYQKNTESSNIDNQRISPRNETEQQAQASPLQESGCFDGTDSESTADTGETSMEIDHDEIDGEKSVDSMSTESDNTYTESSVDGPEL